MSFRARLTLFFFMIVVVPMATVGVLLVQVASSAQTGEADAVLAGGLRASLTHYNLVQEEAVTTMQQAGADTVLANAIRSGDPDAVREALRSVADDHGLVSAVAFDADENRLAGIGGRDAVATAQVIIEDTAGEVGMVRGSTTDAETLAGDIGRITRQKLVISRGDTVLAKTIDIPPGEVPVDAGAVDVSLGDRVFRAAATDLVAQGPDARLILFSQVAAGNFISNSPTVATALVLFFVLALSFVWVLLRSLQGQVDGMLEAAKRIGAGDFSTRIPVQGNDELAALAGEFNNMSGRLASHVAELNEQREELDRSMRRIGDAFAQGLNRQALLEIMIETALTYCEAQHGTAVLLGPRGATASSAGDPPPDLAFVMEEAEAGARRHRQTVEASADDIHAMSFPLIDPDRQGQVLGVMTLARTGDPFSAEERSGLEYLLNQAAVSIENIGKHEKVVEQAVTDELTGLANNRHFRDWMEREMTRAQRFGHELSLALIDADDFKRINDTLGHLQGDEALRALGDLFRSHARDIDIPARYGGEEFAIAMPETGIEGAIEACERIRNAVGRLEVNSIDGGKPVRLTVSVGVACAPIDADDPNGLIAAADEALYRAKQGGKNRTVAARREPSLS